MSTVALFSSGTNGRGSGGSSSCSDPSPLPSDAHAHHSQPLCGIYFSFLARVPKAIYCPKLCVSCCSPAARIAWIMFQGQSEENARKFEQLSTVSKSTSTLQHLASSSLRVIRVWPTCAASQVPWSRRSTPCAGRCPRRTCGMRDALLHFLERKQGSLGDTTRFPFVVYEYQPKDLSSFAHHGKDPGFISYIERKIFGSCKQVPCDVAQRLSFLSKPKSRTLRLISTLYRGVYVLPRRQGSVLVLCG
jgi:hypothetical protein